MSYRIELNERSERQARLIVHNQEEPYNWFYVSDIEMHQRRLTGEAYNGAYELESCGCSSRS